MRILGDVLVYGPRPNECCDLLKSMPTDKVRMRLGTALGAGVIEPVDGLPDGEEDLMCLIMPLRLPDAAV